ncbi:nuclear transport factor 2 family protein [Tsukamurella sp. NPDC003166]|uniref:nuclear transport factor 2 family protein n=1 Tax=Tsukamurella sp. NPDC003166 TaxID=3154444 RepID=UPI0033A2BCA5
MSDLNADDRFAIYDLLGRYSHAVDRQDLAAARSCYHDDAHDDHGRFSGPIDEVFERIDALFGQLAGTFHMMGMPYVVQQGHIARCVTYSFYRRETVGEPGAVMQGLRYLDKLEKRQGRWGIVDRTVVLDWENALSEMPDVPSGPDWSRGAFGPDDPATAFLSEGWT